MTTLGGEFALDQRTITYRYDGLQRLVAATETPGTSYRYAYDLAGNRTQVWENAVAQPIRTYNAANQVIGWPYDAAGSFRADLIKEAIETSCMHMVGKSLQRNHRRLCSARPRNKRL